MPTSALVEHICGEIEDRRKFLDDMVSGAIDEHREMICQETLATSLATSLMEGVDAVTTDAGQVFVKKASP